MNQAIFKKEFILNYPGDVTGVVGRAMGPNLLGERFRAIGADYDAETDKTRVEFELLRPAAPAAQREAA